MEFKVEDVGKKVKDQGGKIYEVVAFQENPSVDLKNIETGNELNIANRCLIADGMKIYEEKDSHFTSRDRLWCRRIRKWDCQLDESYGSGYF